MDFYHEYKAKRALGYAPRAAKHIADHELANHAEQVLSEDNAISRRLMPDLMLGETLTFEGAVSGAHAVRVSVEQDETLSALDAAADLEEFRIEYISSRFYAEVGEGWGQDGHELGFCVVIHGSGVLRIDFPLSDTRPRLIQGLPKGMSRQVKYETATRLMNSRMDRIKRMLNDEVQNYVVTVTALNDEDEELAEVGVCGVELELFDDDSERALVDTIMELARELESELRTDAAWVPTVGTRMFHV